ncbi:MAG: GTPase HflX [Bacteroidota bacterium]|jgi:GTPase
MLNTPSFSTSLIPDQVVLIGVWFKGDVEEVIEEHLKELAFLAETAGAICKAQFIQKLDKPDSRTFIGSGKLNEISNFVKEHEISIAIFDDELSGTQIRNIEKAIACRVLDRSSLILDIFAKRARTAQSKAQVELAQYEYLLPRLTRMWTHLEKQRGGIGMRGPGEAEIETDRRIIRDKLSKLKEKLAEIEKQSKTQRKQRGEYIRVSLVGYTNVGKSTIMNLLSKSDVFAENKLFATLDTTTRKVVFQNIPFLLSDTVGFIRKLPHKLIESFKSTLDEVREADILIHVVDISHPYFEDQLRTVNETLAELGCATKPTLTVFNKIDAYTFIEKDPDDLTDPTKENMSLAELKKSWISRLNGESIFISAADKTNIDEFRQTLTEMVSKLHYVRYPNFLPGSAQY